MGDYLRSWHNFRRLSHKYFSCCHGFRSLVDSEGSCLGSPYPVEVEVVVSIRVSVGSRGSTFFNCSCPGVYSYTVTAVIAERSRKITTKYQPVNSHSAINVCL